MQRPFPNGHKCTFGCNGYVTAVATGQSQRFYGWIGQETEKKKCPAPWGPWDIFSATYRSIPGGDGPRTRGAGHFW